MNTDVNLTWSRPEIFIAKKDGRAWIGKGYKWYVYYYYLNPKTNKLEKLIEKRGINKIKNTSLKRWAIKNMRDALKDFLDEDYSPFEHNEKSECLNDLWYKPKLKITAKYEKGILIPDINFDWFISYYFLNQKTKNFEFIKHKKSYVNEIQDVDSRILALKNERKLLEQKLINGYNPFDEKEIDNKEETLYSITEDDYNYFQILKKSNELKSNYPLIFKNLKSEKIFFKFLKNENIINENHNIMKSLRLNPCSHAFYNVSTDPFNKNDNVLKKNLDKQDFRIFINKYFNKTYKRFSKPTKYESDAQDFFNVDSNFS